MSSGHHAKRDLSASELDDLLAEALANPKIKARLARPFKLVNSFDIAMLGSSSVGGHNVYLDRHLQHLENSYGTIPVNGRWLNVKPGLIRHERLEQALEDELGWPYALAHNVAQHWEERLYRQRGFDPREVERAFVPYIKHDSVERITRSPTDLDMRPLMAPPRSTKIIERVNATAQKEKRSHQSVQYAYLSQRAGQRCGKCSMFVKPEYGGPSCTAIKSPIEATGWCRIFHRGVLGE